MEWKIEIILVNKRVKGHRSRLILSVPFSEEDDLAYSILG
jgi:hypothetical protein